MTLRTSGKHPSTYPPSSGKACPQCGSPVNRIPRRLIDRFASLFAPAHRYQCRDFSCGWEGNLRIGAPAGVRTDTR